MGKITAKKSKTYFRIFLLNPSSPAEGRWQPGLAPGTRPPSLSLRRNPSSVPRPCQFLSSVPLTCAPHGRTRRGTRWLTAMAGDPRRKVWAQTRRRAWAVDTLRPDDAQKALGTGRALGSPCGCAGACSRADGRLPRHEQSPSEGSCHAPTWNPGAGERHGGATPAVSCPWCSFPDPPPPTPQCMAGPSVSTTRGPEHPDSMLTSHLQGIWVEEPRSRADQGQSDFEQVAASLPASLSL